MLRRLGWFTVRRRRWVLAGTLAGMVLAGAFGGGVLDRLSGGGFTDPGVESTRARADLQEAFRTGHPNGVPLVPPTSGSVDDPGVVAAGTALTQELAREPAIQQAFSYW